MRDARDDHQNGGKPEHRASLHIRIVRPAAAFGRDPVDVLVRILDIAGFAVNAVLRVDLEARA